MIDRGVANEFRRLFASAFPCYRIVSTTTKGKSQIAGGVASVLPNKVEKPSRSRRWGLATQLLKRKMSGFSLYPGAKYVLLSHWSSAGSHRWRLFNRHELVRTDGLDHSNIATLPTWRMLAQYIAPPEPSTAVLPLN